MKCIRVILLLALSLQSIQAQTRSTNDITTTDIPTSSITNVNKWDAVSNPIDPTTTTTTTTTTTIPPYFDLPDPGTVNENRVGVVSIPFDFKSYDGKSYQLEPMYEPEKLIDEAEELKSDAAMVTPEDNPNTTVTGPEISKLLYTASGGIVKATFANTYNPWIAYTDSVYLTTLRCCPRAQMYGCKSQRRPLPCFKRMYANAWETCCPVWPQCDSYIAYCNCHTCSVLTPYCSATGVCQRRYTRRSLWHVCYTKGGWVARWISRLMPSSCYCKTKDC